MGQRIRIGKVKLKSLASKINDDNRYINKSCAAICKEFFWTRKLLTGLVFALPGRLAGDNLWPMLAIEQSL